MFKNLLIALLIFLRDVDTRNKKEIKYKKNTRPLRVLLMKLNKDKLIACLYKKVCKKLFPYEGAAAAAAVFKITSLQITDRGLTASWEYNKQKFIPITINTKRCPPGSKDRGREDIDIIEERIIKSIQTVRYPDYWGRRNGEERGNE